MKYYCLLFMLCLSTILIAQEDNLTQTVRGTVFDRDTRQPMIGVTVFIHESEPLIGAATDIDGNFILKKVPVGRIMVSATYTGYKTYLSENINLNSAKELVLDIQMEEAITEILGEEGGVVVTAKSKPNQALNPMALLSTRSFSVEETQRYAGSIADPGRMAMGFAGVQASQDNNNDIVVRGNSPIGVLWRLEGVDIPNPNHFARRGSSGGGISIFSVSMLSNSDFSTGAFAAEYGNAFSSVFDMKFRKGNNKNREYSIRAGMLGLDFSTEGPFGKTNNPDGNGSSYLVNYRYSTLGILSQMGINVVNERTSNTFQDLSFNLNFPSKNNKSIIQLFGIGGVSSEIETAVADTSEWVFLDDKMETDFITNMGIMGLSHTYFISDSSYWKTTLSASGDKVVFDTDTVNTLFLPGKYSEETYTNSRIALSTFYYKKYNSKFNLKTGLIASNLNFNYFHNKTYKNELVMDASGSTFLLQPYAQIRYQPSDRLTLTSGVHSLFFTLNNTYSIEPRIGTKYKLSNKTNISLAYGLHGQVLPIGSYFTEVEIQGIPTKVNEDLDLLGAHHAVAAFEHFFPKNLHLNVEVYYQYLYNVPVVADANRTFWLLNERDGFAEEALVSEGKGRNYGIDITFEKFFSNDLFFLLGGSVYNTEYKAFGDTWYNTRYNGRYATSLMAGKEFNFSKERVLQLSFRNILKGGLRYTPGDLEASRLAREYVPNESLSYSEKVADYWRIDLRVAYRKDRPKFAWTLALDVQNATNRQNVRDEIFDPIEEKFIFRNQAGLIPVISYQLDF